MEALDYVMKGTGWSALDEYTLECPCGDLFELDGECPECGENPLRMNGMI